MGEAWKRLARIPGAAKMREVKSKLEGNYKPRAKEDSSEGAESMDVQHSRLGHRPPRELGMLPAVCQGLRDNFYDCSLREVKPILTITSMLQNKSTRSMVHLIA